MGTNGTLGTNGCTKALGKWESTGKGSSRALVQPFVPTFVITLILKHMYLIFMCKDH